MRITTALAAVAASAALVAGTCAPATAATQDHTDPIGDTTQASEVAPSAAIRDAADILTLQGRHADGRLVFTLTMKDLVRSNPSNYVVVAARFVTPTGRDYVAALQFDEGQKGVDLIDPVRESRVDCEGLAGRAFPSRDQYVLSVPRSCVYNPREVRFGAAVRFAGEDPGATRGSGTRGIVPVTTSASDDARRNGNGNEQIRLGTRTLTHN